MKTRNKDRKRGHGIIKCKTEKESHREREQKRTVGNEGEPYHYRALPDIGSCVEGFRD